MHSLEVIHPRSQYTYGPAEVAPKVFAEQIEHQGVRTTSGLFQIVLSGHSHNAFLEPWLAAQCAWYPLMQRRQQCL